MQTSQTVLLLLTGLALGLRHAFDRDHITAVTHFISLEPDPIKSAWFGFRWAIGHAVTVLFLFSKLLWHSAEVAEKFSEKYQNPNDDYGMC